MKNLNHKFKLAFLLTVLLIPFGIKHARALPPPSDFTISVLNFTQPTDHTIEFDVYLLDTDNTESFELASVQLGFLLNSNIYTGGILTAAIDNTGSGLLATQQFSAVPGIVTPLAGYPDQTLLRLAGRTPPGAGNGTLISSSGNGTLLTHFTLTSTVAWSSSLTANLVFNSSTATIPLYATRVSQYISGVNTALVVTPGTNALVCCNPPLNAFPPATYNVTGSGSYCEGGAGLPVGLSGSETSATYQLYLDGNPTGSPLAGTGSALSFGNKTAGIYTVIATNGSGNSPMNGSAVITTNPLPLQPAAFTASTAVVYQGATGIAYTVPNDPTVTYTWTYSGTGATINGTSNSVTVNYSASATSGNLSVTATNGCGTSAPRSMAITVNTLLPSDYSISVQNMTQPTDRTLEFDVYLLDTDPVQPLELGTVQLGFLLNSGIYTGGTLSVAISNTGSGLIPAQQFTALPSTLQSPTGYPNQTLLRLAGRTPPGAGNGTIISTSGNGTLLTHFILTSTVAWTSNSLTNLIFTSSSAVNPLYATRISAYIGTTNTALTVTPGSNALVCCNPILNNFPLPFNVLGSGSYCEGEVGLPVSLSGSEIDVTYTLYGGPIPEPTLAGTGSAISFGNQLAGVYTISGTNLVGTTVMNGSAVITVNPLIPASITITEDLNNVCAGTTVTFTATPVNGGTNPTIQWYVNALPQTTGLSFAYVPVNGDAVTAVLTSDPALACVTGSPATSNQVSMVVNPSLPASITIAEDLNNVCAGTTVTFTATPVNGGTNPTIQWYVNALPQTTGLSFAYVPVNGDAVTAVLTSDPTLGCVSGSPATSNTVSMVINPQLTASLTITEDVNNVCSGTTVTFTATPVNGGANPTIQWYVNALPQTTGLSFAYVPVNGDAVTAVLTSDPTLGCVSGSPVTSNTVSMVINPQLTASITIAEDLNNVCAGTTVTFTATPVNGGTNPTIQWYVNALPQTTGLSFAYVPVNGDAVTAVLTSDPTLGCVSGSPATSNTVSMVINPQLTASLTITEDVNNVCSGTTVTFTATPVNGGANPTIQWYVNALPQTTGLSFAYVPVNGDAVTAVLTSDPTLGCVSGSPVTSNTVSMVINPQLTASITIAEDLNNVCAGTTVTFTATPVNGGANPTIQWFVNALPQTTGLSFAYVPVNGDAVTAVLTSDPTLACVTGSPATSNQVSMVVNPSLPASITITEDLNNVCAGTTVTFTATPVNGGTNPTIQWYVNALPQTTGLSFAYVPVNGDAVTAVLTSDPTLACVTGSPATSNQVTMVVNPLLPASVTISASANPVNSGTTVTFTAAPVNSGTSPTYQWFVNSVATGTNATYSYVPLNGDQIYVVMTSDPSICSSGSPATSNTITMSVNQPLTPTVLTYSGSTSVQYYSTMTLSAVLKDNKNKGIGGMTITFTIGTQSASAVTNNQGRASTQLQFTQPVGNYTILTSFAETTLYSASTDNDPLVVNRKPVSASLIGTVVKVYDGNNIAYMQPVNYLLNGAIAGDDVSLNNPATGTYNNAKVGTGKKVTVTGLALTGTAASNYILTNTTASANIGTILPAKSVEMNVELYEPERPVIKAYPNPFTERLTIEFTPGDDTRAILDLYDLRGNKVATVFDEQVTGGVTYKVEYEPTGIGFQMLIYRLTMSGKTQNGKVIYMHQ